MSTAGSDLNQVTFRGGCVTVMANLLGQIYEGGHCAPGLHSVMDGLRTVFNGSRACLTRFVDGSTESIQSIEDREFLCDGALDAFQRDPFFSASRRMPVGKAFLQEDLIDSSFRQGELFSKWYAPRDMFSGVSGHVTSGNGSNWFLDVQRGKNQPAFDRDDAQMLEIVISHLMRAWSLAAKVKRDGIETAIAALEDAAFVIDPDGKVELMNPGARALLVSGDGGLHLGPMNHLRGQDNGETNRIKKLVNAARFDQPPRDGQVFLPKTGSSDPTDLRLRGLLLKAIRLPVSDSDLSENTPVLVSARLISSGYGDSHLSELVAREFGLTPAETRIALAMAVGHSLKDAASLAGISFNTARFHLRQIFTKTGTRQQSQLVTLLRPL